MDGELGKGFSVSVARAWEREQADAVTPGVRKIALRMSIVLGAGGGAVNPFINLARLRLGGAMGDGGQMFSWVHIDDVVGSVRHVYSESVLRGPVNVATPHPVTNTQLMADVRAAFGARWGIPTPRWLIEVGARVIRTEPELVLRSRWLHPGVLLDTGYAFAYPTRPEALLQNAGDTRRGLLPVALG